MEPNDTHSPQTGQSDLGPSQSRQLQTQNLVMSWPRQLPLSVAVSGLAFGSLQSGKHLKLWLPVACLAILPAFRRSSSFKISVF